MEVMFLTVIGRSYEYGKQECQNELFDIGLEFQS